MSLRNAINEMCKYCIYDSHSPGNWRQQVDACTSPKCPLFLVRPRSRGMARVSRSSDEIGTDVRSHGTQFDAEENSA